MNLNLNNKWHLRFAVSGICNFRCKYCNASGKSKYGLGISLSEIKEILRAVYELGIKKVHYTGGEPFLRTDFLDIVKYANELGFEEQIVTTNGFNLHKVIDDFIKHGLSRVIISLDTLSPEKFKQITGVNYFEDVKKSIASSVEKLPSLTKISCVTMGSNLKEIPDFIRYIEQINSNSANKGQLALKLNQFHPDNEAQLNKDGQDFWVKEFVSDENILKELKKIGDLKEINRSEVSGDNPSYRYYYVGEQKTIVGVLAMMSWNFPCGRCHKLRLQPSGYIITCKNYDKSPSLIGKTFDEKKQIISDWIEYREHKIDKINPKRIHYYENLGEERWGNFGKPKVVSFFKNLIEEKNEEKK